MDYPDTEGAIYWALNRLSRELSPNLTYHNLWHTKEDVLPTVVRLARLSNVTVLESQLLRVAAAFHDLGFVDTYLGHEQRGADIAANVLSRYGFTPDQITQVQGMILATHLDRAPRNLLEALLADADLDYLGRADFFLRNEALREELRLRGEDVSLLKWRKEQLHFLEAHTYFTSAARSLRQSTKDAHIILLRKGINVKGYHL